MEVWQHMKSTETNRTRAFPRESIDDKKRKRKRKKYFKKKESVKEKEARLHYVTLRVQEKEEKEVSKYKKE